jgi:hypothetical protein
VFFLVFKVDYYQSAKTFSKYLYNGHISFNPDHIANQAMGYNMFPNHGRKAIRRPGISFATSKRRQNNYNRAQNANITAKGNMPRYGRSGTVGSFSRPMSRPAFSKSRTPMETGGGTALPGTFYNHGQKMQLSKSFQKKCRAAVSNNNVQQFKTTCLFTSGFGVANYYVPVQLYDPVDVSTVLSHITSATPTTKFEITDAKVDYQLTNQHDSTCYIRVYECEARGDVPLSATLSSVILYLYQGFTDVGDGSDATDASGTAFASGLFTTWYKINSVKVVDMQPGAVKRFSIHDASTQLINFERWYPGNTNTILSRQKATKFLMFQVWGQTVNDATSSTLVSTDITKIDGIITKRYQFRWSQDVNTSTYSSGSFGNVTTASFIDAATDAVTVNAGGGTSGNA